MKSNIIKVTAVVILSMLVSMSLYAQEKRELSVEDAIKTGLENSYQLHSSQMQVVSAEARLSEVSKLRLPSLSFNATYTRLSEIDPYLISTPFGDFNISENIPNNYSLVLTLQQPIFTGFRLSGNSDIAEYNYLATKETYTADRNTLVYDIKNAYWNLFKANEVKKVTDENVAQVKAHLDDIQNLFKQGLATKNELLRVQVQLSEAQLRQIDANNGVRLANINLNNVIKLPLSTEIIIKENVEKGAGSPLNLDQLTDRAFKNRPELKAMDFRVKASETGIKVAQSSWWPQVYLQGNYNYDRPNQRIFPSEDKFNGTWNVSVALQMNLWNWGQTIDQTTQAEAQYAEAKDTYETLKDAVVLELTQNYLNVLRAEERISVAESTTSQAEENYRVTSEKFKNGLVLNTDLIDAEVDLLQARTNYVQAIVDYQLAKANLEKSIGE
jgi:outer membrane protein TolC